MAIQLHNLKANKSARKKRKVVGRGNASGHGTYSTRGGKGQTARSGTPGLALKGFKRTLLSMPKFKGMKPRYHKDQELDLSSLNKFTDGDKITPQVLFEKSLIASSKKPVKILSNGEISVKLEISGCLLSKKAKEAVEKAGGKVTPVEKLAEKKDAKENKK